MTLQWDMKKNKVYFDLLLQNNSLLYVSKSDKCTDIFEKLWSWMSDIDPQHIPDLKDKSPDTALKNASFFKHFLLFLHLYEEIYVLYIKIFPPKNALLFDEIIL